MIAAKAEQVRTILKQWCTGISPLSTVCFSENLVLCIYAEVRANDPVTEVSKPHRTAAVIIIVAAICRCRTKRNFFDVGSVINVDLVDLRLINIQFCAKLPVFLVDII